MKKLLLGLGLGVATALALTSCGDTEEFEGNGEIFVDKEWKVYEEGHTVNKPIQIDFWSANSAVDIHGRVMAEMVQEFNAYQKKTYPNSPITVKPAFQNGYSNQNSKLQAALIGNTNPDIAMVGVSSMALYKDNAIDMREIFTYDQLRDVFPGFLQFAMYRNKFIAYPYFASTNCMIVNRTLVNKSSVKVETTEEILANPEASTWTWDTFKSYLQDIRNKEEGIYGASMAEIPLYETWFSRGVSPYNEKCTIATIDSPEGLEAFTYWQEIVREDLILNPVLDPNHGSRIQGEFPMGKTGMYLSSSAILKGLYDTVESYKNDNNPDTVPFEVDVLPYPKAKHFYANQSGGGLVVFNNKPDERKRATIEFLRWLQAPENNAKYSIKTGYLVTTNKATETEIWQEYKKENPLLDKVVKLMRFTPADGLRLPTGRAKALADNDFAKYSRGIFYDGCTRDPKLILEDCQKRVSYILETNS